MRRTRHSPFGLRSCVPRRHVAAPAAAAVRFWEASCSAKGPCPVRRSDLEARLALPGRGSLIGACIAADPRPIAQRF